MAIFRGAGVAMVTPMKENGEINYEVLGQLIEDQIAGHTDAIIICGTTGEAPTLEDDEHLEAIRYTVDKTAGRIPVIAGTGSNNTAHAIMMSKEAQKQGADGCLLVAPYYNKATQNGLVKHFAAIAGAVDIPCILYNVPSRTGSNILPETALRLANEVDNIVAIKEASGNIAQIQAILDGRPDGFSVLSGNDDQTFDIMGYGGEGVISVASNVAPELMVSLVEAAAAGDFKKAEKINTALAPLFDACFVESNPIPAKAALSILGLCEPDMRLPLTTAVPSTFDLMRKVIND
jgi:4-hydroxy-tetrahydrodipicolinate synthase